MSELNAVVAKMVCNDVVTTSNRYSTKVEPSVTHKVRLGAVGGEDGEDKHFSDATPSGECWMNINTGRPALAFFQPGKRYYVTFTEAPK
jgi:hypothetical protein